METIYWMLFAQAWQYYVTATELNKKFEQVHYVLDWFG